MTHVQALCALSLLDYSRKGSSVSLQLLNLSSQALVVILEACPLMVQILQEGKETLCFIHYTRL